VEESEAIVAYDLMIVVSTDVIVHLGVPETIRGYDGKLTGNICSHGGIVELHVSALNYKAPSIDLRVIVPVGHTFGIISNNS